MSEAVSMEMSHGELKRRLALRLGTNPDRYGADLGTERHKRLTAKEVTRICELLGLGFVDASKQEKKDMVMIKLGRDHRTGARDWDASDLVAVINRLEADDE